MARRRCNTPRHKQLYAWRKKYRRAFNIWPDKWKNFNQMEYDYPDGQEIDLHLSVFIGKQKRAEMRIQPCRTCLALFMTSLGITKKFVLERELPELVMGRMLDFNAAEQLDKQVQIKERLMRLASFAAEEVLIKLGILKQPDGPPQS